MEMLNKNQIERFLQIEREVVCSADHVDVANRDKLWWTEEETISGLTITTSMTTTKLGVN